MPAAVDAAGQTSASLPVMLADASCLPRMGVKGPQAEAWLRGAGRRACPGGVNAWTRTADGVLVARLARIGVLPRGRLGGDGGRALPRRAGAGAGLYPVLRQDAALVLAGQRLNDLLVQTCSVDFRSQRERADRGRHDVDGRRVGAGALGPTRRRAGADGSGATAPSARTCGRRCSAIAREEGGGRGGAIPDVPLFPDSATRTLSMAQERGRP